MNIDEIFYLYEKLKLNIDKRIEEFKNIWKNSSEKEIFYEFAFCLFTPQSKAKSCWKAVNLLVDKNLILTDNLEDIKNTINLVRFRNKKAEYLIEARKFFEKNGNLIIRELLNSIENTFDKREFLVKNIKGIGYKESSHFLRNVGFVEEIAILDRHILKNLVNFNVIKGLPKNLEKRNYIEIEKRMLEFSKNINIGMEYLDFIFWYKEAGEIFK